jgi:hypothetical protein
MLDKDNIQFLQQFFGKEKKEEIKQNGNEFNIHSECVIKIDKIHNDLLKEKNKYESLYNINTGLVNKIKDLQSQMDDLAKWKDDHICKCDCSNNFNIKETSEYIEIKNINKSYNDKILQLESDIEKIQLNSKIEDNHLFKQIRKQNEILNDEINILKKIKEEDISVEDNSLFKQVQQQNCLLLESNKKLKTDLDDMKNENDNVIKTIREEYQKIIEEYQKIIEELKLNINNNSNKIKKNKEKNEVKNIKTIYLSDSITIYEEFYEPWQKYAGNFTYNKFKTLYNFDCLINEDDNVNKNTYIEVIQWLNDKPSLIKYGNINKLSYHYKRKLNRIVEVYNKYKDRLINININTGFLGRLSDNDYKQWLNILDNKINEKDIILQENCADCKKYEPRLCQRHLEVLQNSLSDNYENNNTDNEDDGWN